LAQTTPSGYVPRTICSVKARRDEEQRPSRYSGAACGQPGLTMSRYSSISKHRTFESRRIDEMETTLAGCHRRTRAVATTVSATRVGGPPVYEHLSSGRELRNRPRMRDHGHGCPGSESTLISCVRVPFIAISSLATGEARVQSAALHEDSTSLHREKIANQKDQSLSRDVTYGRCREGGKAQVRNTMSWTAGPQVSGRFVTPTQKLRRSVPRNRGSPRKRSSRRESRHCP